MTLLRCIFRHIALASKTNMDSIFKLETDDLGIFPSLNHTSFKHAPELLTKCFVQMITRLVPFFQVVKMRSNLERFQLTKLCPFQEKIRRQYLSTNVREKYSNYNGACY